MRVGAIRPGQEEHSAAAAGRISARVIANRLLGGMAWLTLRAAGWRTARPGQFALLQAEPSGCFLARPFSIAGQKDDTVSFLIAPVGPGTRELVALRPGDPVWVLGPLGNGFPADALAPGDRSRLLVVGGGAGVAPFALLLKDVGRLQMATGERSEMLVLLGFRDGLQAEAAAPVVDAVAQLQASDLSGQCIVVTEDGSLGPPGLVTDALAEHVRPHDRVVACGPTPMAQAAWAICRQVPDVRAWFSLETGMACGVGSCHGCTIALADGTLVRVCTDGPVFNGEMVWGPVRSTQADEAE